MRDDFFWLKGCHILARTMMGYDDDYYDNDGNEDVEDNAEDVLSELRSKQLTLTRATSGRLYCPLGEFCSLLLLLLVVALAMLFLGLELVAAAPFLSSLTHIQTNPASPSFIYTRRVPARRQGGVPWEAEPRVQHTNSVLPRRPD
jgi:hypothetical protein